MGPTALQFLAVRCHEFHSSLSSGCSFLGLKLRVSWLTELLWYSLEMGWTWYPWFWWFQNIRTWLVGFRRSSYPTGGCNFRTTRIRNWIVNINSIIYYLCFLNQCISTIVSLYLQDTFRRIHGVINQHISGCSPYGYEVHSFLIPGELTHASLDDAGSFIFADGPLAVKPAAFLHIQRIYFNS